jgi:hypothetical protein
LVGDNKVLDAVAIEIRDGNAGGREAGGIGSGVAESAVAVAEEDDDGAGGRSIGGKGGDGGGEIEFAVAIEVAGSDGESGAGERVFDGGIEGGCPGLPGCWSQGLTEAEALDNIRDAIGEYLGAVANSLQVWNMREVEVSV